MEGDKDALLLSLINLVNEIASFSDYAYSVKKQFCNLVRRLKLLIPMFEEIRDGKETPPEETVKALLALKEAMESAKELLRFGSEGSKIYLVMERDEIMNKFTEVTGRMERVLSETCYEKLDISDEIKEQVELVLGQFRRAVARVDLPDIELFHDILHLYNKNCDSTTDRDIIRRVAEKLQLLGIADLTRESLALHELVAASSGDPGERIEKISMLLKKIKDFVLTENLDTFPNAKIQGPSCSGQVSLTKNQNLPAVPDDFRCPISLELMKDPVIVSTGQTYDRSFIEKWLDAGHGTCPKTQQVLTRTTLTPNYVLRSLIEQWCETHGIDPPKRPTKTASSLPERSNIEILISKLSIGNLEEQRSAACEIRLLAKRNTDNRVAIAEAGAIPPLVSLLSDSDSGAQEHAVTALLNLSICEDNKRRIMACSAIPGIVHVLKKGSMEARENAAATLFSLSVRDQNKIIIGSLGAIPPLAILLSEGTQRGKKDAATALFNLCIYQGNKGRAVRAGVVPTLMRLLMEPGGGMLDEALAVLAILASHPEGKASIGAARAVPILVQVIGNGSSRNRENAAAVLVHLIAGDHCHLVEAKELGVMESLIDMAQNGTDRGKRKAAQLLERMTRFVEDQAQAEAQTQAETQGETQSHAQTPSPPLTATADS